MCGIVAYVGRKVCQPVLIEGLKRLEYRGYDSAGVAVIGPDGRIAVRRAVGRISVLETKLQDSDPLPPAQLGMAHTRWATHGPPTEANAHPHIDDQGQIALVHNGIIENYAALKKFLESMGHTFKSQTDTEVLAVLTEWDEFRWLDLDKVGDAMAGRRVVDARNLLDRNRLRQSGFEYQGIGRS